MRSKQPLTCLADAHDRMVSAVAAKRCAAPDKPRPYPHKLKLGLFRFEAFDSRPGIPFGPTIKIKASFLGPHWALSCVVTIASLHMKPADKTNLLNLASLLLMLESALDDVHSMGGRQH